MSPSLIQPPREATDDGVALVTITQATAVALHDLFLSRAFLCRVTAGTKALTLPHGASVVAAAGDLVILPAGGLVTMENRPLPGSDYRAEGAFFDAGQVAAVFGPVLAPPSNVGVAVFRHDPDGAAAVFARLHDTLADTALSPAIRRHRLLEPLVWLREHGLHLPPDAGATPLARSGLRFATVLRNARLEQGLLLLQSGAAPISAIALDCGFRTPSHLTDAFKARFGITPRAIRQRVV